MAAIFLSQGATSSPIVNPRYAMLTFGMKKTIGEVRYAVASHLNISVARIRRYGIFKSFSDEKTLGEVLTASGFRLVFELYPCATNLFKVHTERSHLMLAGLYLPRRAVFGVCVPMSQTMVK